MLTFGKTLEPARSILVSDPAPPSHPGTHHQRPGHGEINTPSVAQCQKSHFADEMHENARRSGFKCSRCDNNIDGICIRHVLEIDDINECF